MRLSGKSVQAPGWFMRSVEFLLSRRSFQIAFIAALALTLALAVSPFYPGLAVIHYWDKLNHVAAFATLAMLARFAWSRVSVAALALALLGLGVFIEALQLIPALGRSARLGDIVADAIGIAAGLFFAALIRQAFDYLGLRIPSRRPAPVVARSPK